MASEPYLFLMTTGALVHRDGMRDGWTSQNWRLYL